LDKVADETGVDGAGQKGVVGLKISGPVEGSFKHVDGAFVGWKGEPFVFGDGGGDEEGGRERLGKRGEGSCLFQTHFGFACLVIYFASRF